MPKNIFFKDINLYTWKERRRAYIQM